VETGQEIHPLTQRERLVTRHGKKAFYDLPAEMSSGSVINGLIDICRPCAPDVVAHFVRLQANKPFFDADEQRMGIVFECLYDDLKDYPEVAVIIGLYDQRTALGKYWPETSEIIAAVKECSETIFMPWVFSKARIRDDLQSVSDLL